jgi:hypothetical protein
LGIAALVAALLGLIGWRAWKTCQSRDSVHPGKVFVQSYFILGTGAIAVFAAMQELRVYFELIPFFVLLGAHLTADRPVSR